MNYVTAIYAMRKRIRDDDLTRLKTIIEKEIQRRLENDSRSRSQRV